MPDQRRARLPRLRRQRGQQLPGRRRHPRHAAVDPGVAATVDAAYQLAQQRRSLLERRPLPVAGVGHLQPVVGQQHLGELQQRVQVPLQVPRRGIAHAQLGVVEAQAVGPDRLGAGRPACRWPRCRCPGTAPPPRLAAGRWDDRRPAPPTAPRRGTPWSRPGSSSAGTAAPPPPPVPPAPAAGTSGAPSRHPAARSAPPRSPAHRSAPPPAPRAAALRLPRCPPPPAARGAPRSGHPPASGSA